MKPEIHPSYNPAIFVDGENEIFTRTTMSSPEKRTVDGVEYNVFAVDISSYTHPFYTGKQRIVDTAGRVERFKQRYAAKGKRK